MDLSWHSSAALSGSACQSWMCKHSTNHSLKGPLYSWHQISQHNRAKTSTSWQCSLSLIVNWRHWSDWISGTSKTSSESIKEDRTRNLNSRSLNAHRSSTHCNSQQQIRLRKQHLAFSMGKSVKFRSKCRWAAATWSTSWSARVCKMTTPRTT